MDYPSLFMLRDSSTQREAGIQTTRATNGRLKIRRLYSSEKTNFTVVHRLTRAERDQLEAFYQANRTANVTLTWPEDGSVYTVRFGGAPQYRLQEGGWMATVQLLEV